MDMADSLQQRARARRPPQRARRARREGKGGRGGGRGYIARSAVVGFEIVVVMAASRWATGARSFCAASLPGHEAAALRLQAGALCWRIVGFGGVAA